MHFGVIHEHVDLAIKYDCIVDTFGPVRVCMPSITLGLWIDTHPGQNFFVVGVGDRPLPRCRWKVDDAKYRAFLGRWDTNLSLSSILRSIHTNRKLSSGPQIRDGIAARTSLLWRNAAVKKRHSLAVHIVTDDDPSDWLWFHALLFSIAQRNDRQKQM